MFDKIVKMLFGKRHFKVKRIPGFATVAIVAYVALYMPIFTLVFFSFHEGTSMLNWEGFSLVWYERAIQNEAVQEATIRSIVLALSAATIATVAATMAALATTRTRPFSGMTAIFALINQPLMLPEIVTAVALMIFFAIIKVSTGYTGLAYLIAAHTAFCIPFAYMPIRARLESMNLTLETAAADLYASPWQVFHRVTLPLMAPGIMAGYMIAFVISLDDVVITEFVKSAGQETLPSYMLGQIRRGVTPEINAISTALLMAGILLVSLFFYLNQKRK
jgi:spermidine/putrescine transport system permease protein